MFSAPKSGDHESSIFCVEKNRMLFVRLRGFRTGAIRTNSGTIRFRADYTANMRAGVGSPALWKFNSLTETSLTRTTHDINGDAKLDPAIFDSKQFTSAHWESPEPSARISASATSSQFSNRRPTCFSRKLRRRDFSVANLAHNVLLKRKTSSDEAMGTTCAIRIFTHY